MTVQHPSSWIGSELLEEAKPQLPKVRALRHSQGAWKQGMPNGQSGESVSQKTSMT